MGPHCLTLTWTIVSAMRMLKLFALQGRWVGSIMGESLAWNWQRWIRTGLHKRKHVTSNRAEFWGFSSNWGFLGQLYGALCPSVSCYTRNQVKMKRAGRGRREAEGRGLSRFFPLKMALLLGHVLSRPNFSLCNPTSGQCHRLSGGDGIEAAQECT